MNPIRQVAEGLVQRWVDQGLLPSFRFLMRDDVEMVIRQEIEAALTEADLMRASAVEDAMGDMAALALELIDVVDGSGGGMLDVEPYKSKYAKLKDLGAAPSGGNHAKEAEQAGGQEILAQGEEAVVRDAVAVRPDAEPNADDGRG